MKMYKSANMFYSETPALPSYINLMSTQQCGRPQFEYVKLKTGAEKCGARAKFKFAPNMITTCELDGE